MLKHLKMLMKIGKKPVKGDAKRCSFQIAGAQLQGVLDELFFYEGPLGACITAAGVELHVWAPTAHQVIFTPENTNHGLVSGA